MNEAGGRMQAILTSVKRVADIVDEISAASFEQRAGIHQVAHAVAQMDSATQQNATLIEQAGGRRSARSALIYASLTCPMARASASRFSRASYRARTPNRQGAISVDDCTVLTSAPSSGVAIVTLSPR